MFTYNSISSSPSCPLWLFQASGRFPPCDDSGTKAPPTLWPSHHFCIELAFGRFLNLLEVAFITTLFFWGVTWPNLYVSSNSIPWKRERNFWVDSPQVLLLRVSLPYSVRLFLCPCLMNGCFHGCQELLSKSVSADIHFLAVFVWQLTVSQLENSLLMRTSFPGTRT